MFARMHKGTFIYVIIFYTNEKALSFEFAVLYLGVTCTVSKIIKPLLIM